MKWKIYREKCYLIGCFFIAFKRDGSFLVFNFGQLLSIDEIHIQWISKWTEGCQIEERMSDRIVDHYLDAFKLAIWNLTQSLFCSELNQDIDFEYITEWFLERRGFKFKCARTSSWFGSPPMIFTTYLSYILFKDFATITLLIFRDSPLRSFLQVPELFSRE